MGSKAKCPGCGAKNDAASRRCRVCTRVINPDAAEQGSGAAEPVLPGPAPVPDDHFDAGVIDRQLQPARSKFSDGSSALAARLAAARAVRAPAGSSGDSPAAPPAPAGSFGPPDPTSPPPSAPWSAPAPSRAPGPDGSNGFVPLGADELGARPAPPTAPAIEFEAEPFDPDALFRDDG